MKNNDADYDSILFINAEIALDKIILNDLS
jgi:hypothetical protein